MEINSGRLSFDPAIEPAQVSPSAVDLRLSDQFTVFNPPHEGETTHLDLTRIPNIEDTIKRHAAELRSPAESRNLSGVTTRHSRVDGNPVQRRTHLTFVMLSAAEGAA